jgi:Tfp pilus assembly pilus retraction ATPase PilT
MNFLKLQLLMELLTSIWQQDYRQCLRVSGRLQPTEFPRLLPDMSKRLIYSILNDKQKERFEKEWELDCSHGIRGFGRFRVNVFKQRGVVGAALRAIPSSIPSRDELGLPKIVDEIGKKPHGLILVTGATGMGKSTTIAYMLDKINTEREVSYNNHRRSRLNIFIRIRVRWLTREKSVRIHWRGVTH